MKLQTFWDQGNRHRKVRSSSWRQPGRDSRETLPDDGSVLSARLSAVPAPQMADSAIGGYLLLISTPTEPNVHNAVCSIPAGV